MTINEAKQYINSNPKIYLCKQHNIIIKGHENTRCPACGGGKDSTKFSIHQGTNKLHCFSCNFHGDTLDLIAHDNNMDIRQNFKDIMRIACGEYGISLEIGKEISKRGSMEQKLISTQLAVPKYEVLSHYDFTDIILQTHNEVNKTEYFKNRGFSDELIQKYKLGFSQRGYNILFQKYPELKNKIWKEKYYQYVIPVLNQDETCNYFMVRGNEQATTGDKSFKIMNMRNVDNKNPIRLFNDRYIINHDQYNMKTLFIVEGWADALSIEEVGYSAIALNSTSNIRKFLNLCKIYNPKYRFVICLDGDDAGQKAKNELLKDLEKQGYEAIEGNIFDACNDANDFLLQDRHAFTQKLMEVTGQKKEPVIYESYSPIKCSGNQYHIETSKGEKRISNFIMEPVSLIQSHEGGTYIIRFRLNNGKVLEKKVKSSAFSNVRSFKQVLNKESAELSFMGNDVELEHVKIYMLMENPYYEQKLGIDYIGIHKYKKEHIFVGIEESINWLGKQVPEIISMISENRFFENQLLSTEPINKQELKELSEYLFYFNTLTRTVPIISWCSACFLKSRLKELKIRLSHLLLHGTAGSGKTDTATTFIKPFFGLDSEPIACGRVKEFALLKTCSGSNLFPIILDEYKPARLGVRQLNMISETLRSAYDNHTVQRGNPDQSVTNYKYRAPIVLVGESSTEEKAVKERSIEVLFGKIDRTQFHTDNYKKLKARPELLTKLGKRLLLKVMSLSDLKLKQMIEESKQFEQYNYESRNLNGLMAMRLGSSLLEQVYKDLELDFENLTGLSQIDIEKELINNMDDSVSENGLSKTAVEQIIEVFDLMAGKKILLENRDYVMSKDVELQLYMPSVYSEFTKYFKDYNIHIEVDYITKNNFLAQLRKTEYFIDDEMRTFRGVDGNDSKRRKCFILDLSLISKNLDTDTFRLSKDTEPDFEEVRNEQIGVEEWKSSLKAINSSISQ